MPWSAAGGVDTFHASRHDHIGHEALRASQRRVEAAVAATHAEGIRAEATIVSVIEGTRDAILAAGPVRVARAALEVSLERQRQQQRRAEAARQSRVSGEMRDRTGGSGAGRRAASAARRGRAAGGDAPFPDAGGQSMVVASLLVKAQATAHALERGGSMMTSTGKDLALHAARIPRPSPIMTQATSVAAAAAAAASASGAAAAAAAATGGAEGKEDDSATHTGSTDLWSALSPSQFGTVGTGSSAQRGRLRAY